MNWPLWLILICSALVSYLVGSLSFAVIAGRLFRGIDIRKEGSGNAGSTNVFRILGWKLALPVLIADLMKGFLPVFFATRIVETAGISSDLILEVSVLAGVLAGHAFPLWFGFRGGKGVASAAGGVMAIYPPVAPVCLIVFIAVLAITRYVSLSSILVAWTLPIAYSILSLFLIGDFTWWLMSFFLVAACGVTYLHRKNIHRLIAGEEQKIG